MKEFKYRSRCRWAMAILLASTLAMTLSGAGVEPLSGVGPIWSDAGVSLALAGALALAAPVAARDPAVGLSWLDAGASRKRNAEAARGGDLLEVVWKSELIGAGTGYDFDSWRLDFAAEEGRVSTVREFEVGGGVLRESAVYRVLRGEGLTILSRQVGSGAEPPQPFATLLRDDGGWLATSATQRSLYRPLDGGGLGIKREVYGGSRGEDYRAGGRGEFTRDGELERRGFLGEGSPRTWVERKPGDTEGILDRLYWYDRVADDSLSVSIGEVEPVAVTGFEGASAYTAGPNGLENLVIADLILGLDRRATPVLALAWLGELPRRGP